MRRRRTATLAVACLILVLLVCTGLIIGSGGISVSTAVDAVFHFDHSPEQAVVRDLRWPRTLLGIIVGAALGVSGTVIQTLTRNPIADPGLLGVNAGAAFAVSVGVAVFSVTSIWGFIWFAFLGAFVLSVLVFVLGSSARGGASPLRLTLAGVAAGALLTGLTTGLTLVNPVAFDQMRFWRVGTLADRGMTPVVAISGFVVVGVVVAWLIAGSLDTVALGDDVARGLGAGLFRTRLVGVAVVTILCGAATAAAGPIAFVGLMVPHVSRRLVGNDGRWIIVFSAVCGAIVVVASDVVARLVIRPGELSVGTVTAFLGAPVLIWLIRRSGIRV